VRLESGSDASWNARMLLAQWFDAAHMVAASDARSWSARTGLARWVSYMVVVSHARSQDATIALETRRVDALCMVEASDARSWGATRVL
jgi:hypothetical protein